MSVSTLKQIFDQKPCETEATTTNIVISSPTKAKSKLSVVNVPLSSTLVQQSIAVVNNASRLKNKPNNQQLQKSFNSTLFDDKSSNGSSKALNFLQKNYRNEDNSVSHQPPSSNNKMVAKQEIVIEPTAAIHQNENEEDFKYGPGFVSKLRYRYLSLTLRQTSASKQRPSILELRRSTSLNNLLDGDSVDVDEEEEDDDEEEGEQNEDLEREENYEDVRSEKRKIGETNGNNKDMVLHENQKNHTRNGIDKHKTMSEYYAPSESLPHHQIQSIRSSRSIDKNLNLKRARSVEAILRYDHSSWERDIQKDQSQNNNFITNNNNEPIILKGSHDITIEDKIHNARERSHNAPPKRLTSLIDDDERPPPGICKQTMRIFEASANKKRNIQTRPIAQEIANKMAIFKSQNEKPVIVAKKPNILPRTSSPKPIIINQHHMNQVNNYNSNNMNNGEKFAKYAKEKTVLPKLDINIIKNNLETKSNGVSTWSPVDNKDSYRTKLDYSPAHSDSSLSSTPNILSPYRNSMSPQLNEHLSPKKAVTDPSSSPIISSLTNKLSNLHMESTTTSTPKLSSTVLHNNRNNNNLLKSIDDESENVVYSDKESSDKKFNTNNNVTVELKGVGSVIGNCGEVKSDDSSKNVNFSQKINNNNNLTKMSTTTAPVMPKVNHEKSVVVGVEMNNGHEVKLVKENSMIMKPTTKPPPPPISTSSSGGVKALQPRDNDTSSKNSLITSNENAKDSSALKRSHDKKKSWSSQATDAPTNSIVFNFSDRKDVPDYIDNDGLILRRKREMPKPNESGFVLLGDLTLDSSSTDLDDAYHMGPPSPCDVEFENANIVPDGKSSIRTGIKEVKFKIQFDDSLTATFEYPSETSLLVEETFGEEDEVDANFYGSSSKLLTSVPLGSTPFANYQPQKASSSSFELGITRTTPSPSSASSESENTFISNPDEDDSDYLKPATDEESHRWSSEETRGTDLLF